MKNVIAESVADAWRDHAERKILPTSKPDRTYDGTKLNVKGWHDLFFQHDKNCSCQSSQGENLKA